MISETPVVFECEGDRLIGVITVPDSATQAEVALLVIVGGPQYRAGSHRQFVQLARQAAKQGFAAMRFDVRGMGDSDGAQRSFEEIEEDVTAALDALHREVPGLRSVGLWGLCGGASAALLYCLSRPDPRVAGVALINPWVRSEITQARTRVKHYYTQRLLQGEFWKKLLKGKVAATAVGELVRALRVFAGSAFAAPTEPKPLERTLDLRMAEGLARFEGETLVVLSGNDYTAKEFIETVQLNQLWRGQLAKPQVSRIDIVDADHTFSQPAAQALMEDATLSWLGRLGPTVRH